MKWLISNSWQQTQMTEKLKTRNRFPSIIITMGSRKSRKNCKKAQNCENRKTHGKTSKKTWHRITGLKIKHYTVYKALHLALTTITACSAHMDSIWNPNGSPICMLYIWVPYSFAKFLFEIFFPAKSKNIDLYDDVMVTHSTST